MSSFVLLSFFFFRIVASRNDPLSLTYEKNLRSRLRSGAQ